MSGKTIKKILFGLMVAFLLLGSFFAGRIFYRATNVQAQGDPPNDDRALTHDCTIIEVALLDNRAHIRCSNGYGAIYFFAVANTSANETLINRVMAIGLTNMSMDRKVYLYFDGSSANNPVGCLVSDCRKLTGVIGYK